MDFLFGDLETFIQAVGIIGIFFIVFAESGLLVGIILPGDTLLVTAGILASQGYFNILFLVSTAIAGAILGDNVGYAFGKRVGPALFKREDSFFFHKDHLLRAQKFYERFGGMTLVYARFLPVIRTFAPILAGVGTMNYKKFLFFNALGGTIWAIGLPLVGFTAGNLIPDINRYIAYIVGGIALITILPPIFHAWSRPDIRNAVIKFFHEKFSS